MSCRIEPEESENVKQRALLNDFPTITQGQKKHYFETTQVLALCFQFSQEDISCTSVCSPTLKGIKRKQTRGKQI